MSLRWASICIGLMKRMVPQLKMTFSCPSFGSSKIGTPTSFLLARPPENSWWPKRWQWFQCCLQKISGACWPKSSEVSTGSETQFAGDCLCLCLCFRLFCCLCCKSLPLSLLWSFPCLCCWLRQELLTLPCTLLLQREATHSTKVTMCKLCNYVQNPYNKEI